MPQRASPTKEFAVTTIVSSNKGPIREAVKRHDQHLCYPKRRALSLHLRRGGLVLLQVGTAFVTPTDGQEYDPTDGAVTVPIGMPDAP